MPESHTDVTPDIRLNNTQNKAWECHASVTEIEELKHLFVKALVDWTEPEPRKTNNKQQYKEDTYMVSLSKPIAHKITSFYWYISTLLYQRMKYSSQFFNWVKLENRYL